MNWLLWLIAIFTANLAWIIGFAGANLAYVANVLLHPVLGLSLFAGWRELRKRDGSPQTLLLIGLLASLVTGAVLAYNGNIHETRPLLLAHLGLSAFGYLLLLWAAFTTASAGGRKALMGALACAVVVAFSGRWYQGSVERESFRVRNPVAAVPVSMQEEGGGPKSPFWPSSAKTNVGGVIPADFFMDSKRCGECHKDIYEQWNSSMHHFASFNNQFYRKSIEHMQEVQGSTQGSKWCAGCHDHAVFFNGRFEKPMKDQIDTPEAQNGLGCMSCHSIVHVDSSMGNAGFTIEYPPLHKLASSKNPFIKWVDDRFTFLKPEPHKKTFMKPFMRGESAEFCSSCHKVHLDVPVNNYRWMRGFNDYDNWQASGVSGQGARSFYYPAKSQTCAECHMPKVPSKDPAAREGHVHSHRFPGANTAVPFVNGDKVQLETVEKFLTSGFITVDIFAAAPVDESKGQTEMRRRGGEGTPTLMSTFAVGEEAEQSGQVMIREVGKIAAPIDQAGVKFERGSTVRLDVVVRTRRIGHFFPGGTVDAFDIWLELQGKDADGRVVFWNGRVEDEGRGPVDPGAHFYRSYQLDGEGNMINKRNAWQTRSLLYVRLIPPGAADTAHYRVKIPKDARGPITMTAKLHYRKFSHYYTKFAYAGKAKPGQDPNLVSIHSDSREYSFDKSDIPANVSGALKGEIPVLPIVTLAEATAKLDLSDSPTNWKPVTRKDDRERWNDWGIGMLAQGDLKGAEYAFRRVTEAEPGYADGWLNVARALIQEGETQAAQPFVERAMSINPELGRVWFFKSQIEKADGDYDGALKSLEKVAALYPRDRVALNQIGRILFLQRKYKEAVAVFERVLGIDPEDLQAHYNLMLACRGMGDAERASREEKLFRRFKADESAQELTAKPRLLSPEDNNERQTIHEHDSSYTNAKDPGNSTVRGTDGGRTTAAPLSGRNSTGGH